MDNPPYTVRTPLGTPAVHLRTLYTAVHQRQASLRTPFGYIYSFLYSSAGLRLVSGGQIKLTHGQGPWVSLDLLPPDSPSATASDGAEVTLHLGSCSCLLYLRGSSLAPACCPSVGHPWSTGS